MHIWVDADACPKVIREILFRAAQRTNTRLTLVANGFIPTPPGTLIDALRVSQGFDVADNTIVAKVQPGDLVITADIPLAADVIERDALALNPRGELYTPENVRQRLAMRDFLDTMRSSGIQTGGPAAMSATDRQQFANQLDRILAKKNQETPRHE
ncbi:MAG: YaiI/YqxD family protein [Oceanospirillaceae bacterium]|nr:YaiI/YqxD family protein [Oceanospirillaceae bacterium]